MDNIHEFLNSTHQEQIPLFLDFPSPFFDDISSTTPTHTSNNYTTHDQNHHLTSPNKATNIIPEERPPLPSDSKNLKKRSHVGRKDRHSKIHTAQGLRDRRMRLSLHIARRFFDLQDLLGFDKASKTIEWLFCKSNKAIKEVAQSFNQSISDESNIREIKNSKEEMIKNRLSKKQIQTRDQARARARDRTRERLMVKELERSKLLFGGNPKEAEIYKLGLGHIASPNNHHKEEELGFISISTPPDQLIQQESSSSSLDQHSAPYRLLREPQLATLNLESFEDYSGMNYNHNPAEGWLNSCNEFFPGDADNLVTEYYNCGIVPTNVGLTGGTIYEQNPSPFLMSSTTNNILHVQSQNQSKIHLQ